MGWYIASGSIAYLVVIVVSVMFIRELYFINKDYKKDMDYYNNSENHKFWFNEPQKRNIENASSYVLCLALGIMPLFVTAISQIIVYYGNIELAETYKYLSQYETYDFDRGYDSIAIKNNILIKFNDFNESLAKAKTNISKFPFWTFDSKEIINNLDYLMFK